MAFTFGLISSLNITIATISFVVVILFILFFEFWTDLLEFLVSESPIYNHMIQRIYKVLMLMGLVSFVNIMVLADQSTIITPEIALCLQFAHIIIFCMTIFFVCHSFYIMWTSYSSSKAFSRYHNEKLPSLLARINSCEGIEKYLYEWNFFSLSSLRQIAEYKILYVLFEDTYWFPESFNFSLYLTYCFENYALKIMDRGIFSWIVLLILILLNFIRVKFNLGFNCGNIQELIHHALPSENTTSSHAIFSYETQDSSVDLNLDGSISTSSNPCMSIDRMLYIARALSSAGGVPNPHSIPGTCYMKHVELFFICGTLIVAYALFMVCISRLYIARLISRVGVGSVSDYMSFLNFISYEREKVTTIYHLYYL